MIMIGLPGPSVKARGRGRNPSPRAHIDWPKGGACLRRTEVFGLNHDELPLNRLPIGRAARVTRLTAGGATRRRLLDLGIVEGTAIEPLFRGPSGNPVAYRVRGTVIALRADASRGILVSAGAEEE